MHRTAAYTTVVALFGLSTKSYDDSWLPTPILVITLWIALFGITWNACRASRY